MRGAGAWALGLAASVAVHLGAGAALMAALQPEPVADQPPPQSRLNVEALEVERSEAAAQRPPAETADSTEPEGTALGVGAIAQSVAVPVAAPAQAIAPLAPQARADAPPPLAPQAAMAAATAPPVVPAVTAELPLAQAQAETVEALRVASAAAPATAAAAETLPALTARPVAAPSQLATPQAAPSLIAPPQAPQVTASKAVLAFPSQGQVDPVSLAAFQSFTQPEAATGTDLRDALTAALSIPCARMQVIFDPDSTTLQLTGHIPDPAQRGPLLEALQAQMGSDIAVADNLLILPAPQCAALSGIAAVGLPQSTDQITNPLIVGADTHARAFDFRAGQPLVIDMGGADYEAYVYLDYFDADGNVIHLSPNERAPLQRVAAKAPVSFGARRAEDPGLLVQIGPPFGQEIAAAFAASVPLYDGLRPIIEPAAPYLAWMRERVAEARAAHPDFKGEWVYFFVSTAP